MSDIDEFFAGFTKHELRRPRSLVVGDHVKIKAGAVGAGMTGKVTEIGIEMPWCSECIKVDRDNGTGEGIYMPSDVRRI